MNIRDLDNRVISAFDELVNKASRSSLLGEIAMQPNKRHESVVEDLFRGALQSNFSKHITIPPDQKRERYGKQHDIIMMNGSEAIAKIEIKVPFTNKDGIRHKTRRKSIYLPKDMDSLKAALEDGVIAAYELVTPIGCFPVDSDGEMIVLEKSIGKNENTVKAQYGIKWPTRHDYETNVGNGKQEVDIAMEELAIERGLEVTRLKDWQKVLLPSPQPNIHTFLDCALYKVKLK